MKKIFYFTGVVIMMLHPFKMLAQSDSLWSVMMDSVVVIGFDSEQQLREVPGGIHLLKSRDLSSFDDETILTSMNVLPGVHMEQRSPGSYRMAIRGSTLRRSEEHTSELQSRGKLVCRRQLEKKKNKL